MTKTCYISIQFLFLLIVTLSVNAQTVSTTQNVVDTSNNTADKAVKLLLKSDSIAIADSINAVVLQRQLEELKSFERSKRLKIERELAEIKEKDSIRQMKMIEEVKRLKNKSTGYPVLVHKDTLFFVYTKIGALTAEERARIINERLKELYRSFLLQSDSIILEHNGQNAELYFKDKILLSITELDELWFEKTKTEIASEYKSLITSDIAVYKKDRSLLKTVKEIGLALVVILIQWALIKALNVFFKLRINTYIELKKTRWFKGVKFRNQEIINQEKQTAAALFLAKIIRLSVITILLYLSIPILFSIFPPTQRLAEVLFGYILSPVRRIAASVLGYIPELITIGVIITIVRYVLKVINYLALEIGNEKITIPGFFPEWAKPSYNIIKMLILAFMFVVIFPYLPGSDSEIFKGVSVFIGIVFSLGSTSIIGNMIAGLVITYMRPFKIGDRIKIGEVTGNVVEKTAFVTRIRTPKKEFITIPNSNILSSNVINYSNSKQQGGLVVHTTVTIGYDVPWRQVHQILINAAKKTSNLNLEIAPFVLQTSLDDFYVSYQLNAHTNEPDKQPAIYSELHQNIQDGFNEQGIEILSPHYRAARDGNAMAVPKDYLPDEYSSPAFKIKNEKE